MTDRFDDGPTEPHRTLDPNVRQELHREVTGDDLVAAVYANPADDEPRLVYGDYLLERDDPRGEFVQLQLARHGSGEPPSDRERELFAAHVRDWTAPLYDALHPDSIVFERGFLARCAARDRTIDLRDVIGHPMWLTVEELTSDEITLVTHPCLRSLVTLRTSVAALSALAGVAHDVKVETVEVEGASRFRNLIERPWPEDVALWRHIHDVGALPRVRSLSLRATVDPDANATRELLASKLGRQLIAFGGEHERGPLAPWIEVLHAHPSLRRIALGPERGYSRTPPRHAKLVFERDDRDRIQLAIEIDEQLPLANLVQAVNALPPQTIEVEGKARPITDDMLRTLGAWCPSHTFIRRGRAGVRVAGTPLGSHSSP